jgi:hypothetical protein
MQQFDPPLQTARQRSSDLRFGLAQISLDQRSTRRRYAKARGSDHALTNGQDRRQLLYLQTPSIERSNSLSW